MGIDDQIREAVKNRLHELNVTPHQLCKATKVCNDTYLYRYLHGKKTMSNKKLDIILLRLGLHINVTVNPYATFVPFPIIKRGRPRKIKHG